MNWYKDNRGEWKEIIETVAAFYSYCSNMAKAGMNLKTLQYLMGHSDISDTMNV